MLYCRHLPSRRDQTKMDINDAERRERQVFIRRSKVGRARNVLPLLIGLILIIGTVGSSIYFALEMKRLANEFKTTRHVSIFSSALFVRFYLGQNKFSLCYGIIARIKCCHIRSTHTNTYKNARKLIHTHTNAYTHTYTYTHTATHAHLRAHTFSHVHTRSLLHILTNAHQYIYSSTRTNTHTHARAY